MGDFARNVDLVHTIAADAERAAAPLLSESSATLTAAAFGGPLDAVCHTQCSPPNAQFRTAIIRIVYKRTMHAMSFALILFLNVENAAIAMEAGSVSLLTHLACVMCVGCVATSRAIPTQ